MSWIDKVIKTANKSLPNKLKQKINADINNLIKVNYFEAIPLENLFAILEKHYVTPVQEDLSRWSGMLMGKAECGSDKSKNQRALIDLLYQDQPLDNKLLVSWCVMPSGKYEVTSYVS